jgi:hypothetical protein
MSTAELEAQKAELATMTLDETGEYTEKLPWTMTLEEKKESIRQAEEDYKAGRLRTTEEVFAKYL